MNTELILKADLLDIIFRDRNKDYGAYMLRKFYPNRLKTSLIIMFSSAALLSASTFLPSGKQVLHPVFLTDPFIISAVEPPLQPEPPKPKPKLNSQIPSQKKFTNNFLFVADTDSTQKFDDLTKFIIGDKTIINPAPGAEDAVIGEIGGQGNQPVAKEPEEVLPQLPTDNPDIQASFPGGQKELIRFLERNLRSPKDIEAGEVIQVQVKFVVNFDGELQSFNVVKDGGQEFNKEVVRVLKKMPKWNPGKKGGQNIPVYYTIPVKFTSNE